MLRLLKCNLNAIWFHICVTKQGVRYFKFSLALNLDPILVDLVGKHIAFNIPKQYTFK